MQYEISKTLWQTCKLCGKTINELSKIHGGNGVYFFQVFSKHLELDHKISKEEYFEPLTGRPECGCGTCKQLSFVYFKLSYWKEFVCGRNPGILKWSEEAKISRKGENNPMYGATPWNKGLTAETSEVVKGVRDGMVGRKIPEESKQKMSESAKKRLIHGHTGFPHSEETKQFLRENTLRLIKEGRFSQTNTKPVRAFIEILKNIDIEYEQEKILDCWSFDFYLPKYDIYIEVDGDYFHSNPIIYPDGPKTKTQKRNWYRDLKKTKFCQENNLSLIRFWECDILNNPEDIREFLCNMKK